MLSTTSVISSQFSSDYEVLSQSNQSFEFVTRSVLAQSFKPLREIPEQSLLNNILEIKPEHQTAHNLLTTHEGFQEILSASELFNKMGEARSETQELQMYESHVSIRALDGDAKDVAIQEALDQRAAVLVNEQGQEAPFKAIDANQIADEMIKHILHDGVTSVHPELDEHSLESLVLDSAEMAANIHNEFALVEGVQNYILTKLTDIHHAHFLNDVPWTEDAQKSAVDAMIEGLSAKGAESSSDPSAVSELQSFVSNLPANYTVSNQGSYFKARKSQSNETGLARLDATQIKTAKGDVYELLSTLTDHQKFMVEQLTKAELVYSSKFVRGFQVLLAQYQNKGDQSSIKFHDTSLMRRLMRSLDKEQKSKLGTLDGSYEKDKRAVQRLLHSLDSSQIEAVEKLTHIKAEKNKVLIGQGAYGTVRLARNVETGKLFVIKKMLDRSAAEHEIKSNNLVGDGAHFVTAIDHAHVKTSSFNGDSVDKSYLIFPYYDAGDGAHMMYNLQQLKNQNPQSGEMKQKFIAYTLLSAVDDLHQRDLVHRDIKPENLLFSSEGAIGLSDFGLAENDHNPYRNKEAGTPGYLPPEFGTQNYTGKGHDLYSAGMAMLEFATGQYIEEGKTINLKVNGQDIPLSFNGPLMRCNGIDPKVLKSKLHFNSYNEVIAGLLVTNSAARIDAKKAKASPYFADFNAL